MTFLNDLSFTQALVRGAAYLIIAAIHAFAWAAIAGLLGDRDPAFAGRRTLNPFVQASLPGLISAILFRVGWSKPVVTDPVHLRWGRLGALLVLFGGLAVLLVVVGLCNPLRLFITDRLTGSNELNALGVVQEVQQQSIFFVLFNLLPLPGLAGQLWLLALRPGLGVQLRRYELPVMIVIILVEMTGVVATALAAPSAWLSHLLVTQIS
ncbi:MAG TPA: hypothetical protein VHB74_13495 [Devosia sp.]|nr:hypothetical protein [Devosia sp.]